MTGDEGARRIRRLLDAGSPELKRDFTRLLDAVAEMPQRTNGVPAPATFAAISRIRSFYRRLRRTIAVVDTKSSAKADVLAALDVFDQGFAVFGTALHRGFTPQGKTMTQQANVLTKRAAKDLRSARARLG